MNTKYFLPLISLIFMLSCSKSDDINQPTCKISGVNTTFNGGPLQSASIEYDIKNRVSKIVSTSDSAFRSFTATYNTNNVILSTKYYGNWTFTLDAQGRTSLFEAFNGAHSCTYTYNADGYVSKVVVTDFPYVSTYMISYTDGNITKITCLRPESFSLQTITLEYTTENSIALFEVPDPLSFAGQIQPLPGFFGKTSKNLLSKVTNVSTSTRSTDLTEFYTTFFTYTKNSEGRISTVNQVEESTDLYLNYPLYLNWRDTKIYNLTYNCH